MPLFFITIAFLDKKTSSSWFFYLHASALLPQQITPA
jgi:hypothetical protein